MITRANGRGSLVAKAIGSDTKSRLSLCAWAADAGLAWLSPWIAYTLYGGRAAVVRARPPPRIDRIIEKLPHPGRRLSESNRRPVHYEKHVAQHQAR